MTPTDRRGHRLKQAVLAALVALSLTGGWVALPADQAAADGITKASPKLMD